MYIYIYGINICSLKPLNVSEMGIKKLLEDSNFTDKIYI